MNMNGLSPFDQVIVGGLMKAFSIKDPHHSRVRRWVPPFDRELLEEITSLRFLKNLDARSDSLSVISTCKSLTNFRANGCEIHDLDFLERLTDLKKITCEYSSLKSISALRGMSMLTQANFKNSLIEDLSPLMELEHLDEMDVRGNPLTEHSYYELLPQLKARFEAQGDLDFFHFSDEENWRWSRELCDRGIRACALRGRTDGRLMICFPGLAISKDPTWEGTYTIKPEELRRLLDDPSTTTESLFAYQKSPEYMKIIKGNLIQRIKNAAQSSDE